MRTIMGYLMILLDLLKGLFSSLIGSFKRINLFKQEDFFRKFLKDIPENEIKDYKIILPNKFSMLMMSNNWLYFSEHCDEPMAIKDIFPNFSEVKYETSKV